MRKAFTLIELLIVVAIIAILAAILLPVFAQAKASSQRTVCISNLKQISTGWTLYTDDSDQVAAPSYYPELDGATEVAWDFTNGREPGLLFPYLKSKAIQGCPTFRGKTWGRLFTGYGYNATYLGGDYWDDKTAAALSLFGTPSETVAFADTGYGRPVAGANYLRAPSDSLFVAGKVHARHLGKASISYLDGHIRSLSLRDHLDPFSPTLGALSQSDEAYDFE